MNNNPIETRIASVFKDELGIITITIKDCGTIDEFDLIDLNLVLRHKSEGKAALKLLDARANWQLSKKGRVQARKQDLPENTKARAVLVSNQIKLTLFRFLKSFGEKSYPQQFFTDKTEAYDWLQSFINS